MGNTAEMLFNVIARSSMRYANRQKSKFFTCFKMIQI